MQFTQITLMGAYGRKYDTAEDAIYDWRQGKDFKVVAGPYTSIRDKQKLIDQFETIVIRWKLSSFVNVTNEEPIE